MRTLATMSSPSSSHPEPHRWSTADLAGPTLIFVGAFLLAVTIALPTLLVGGFRTIPLSTDFTTVAASSGSSASWRYSRPTNTG